MRLWKTSPRSILFTDCVRCGGLSAELEGESDEPLAG